jgi:hypothetical protein
VAGHSDKPRPTDSDADRGASAPATRISHVDTAATAATTAGLTTTADHRFTGPVPCAPHRALTQGQTTTPTQRHMPPAITNAAQQGPLKRIKAAEAEQRSPSTRGTNFYGGAAPHMSPPAAPTFTTTLKQGTFFSRLR